MYNCGQVQFNVQTGTCDLMKLFTSAFLEAVNSKNILSGFRKTRIWFTVQNIVTYEIIMLPNFMKIINSW